MTINGRTDFVGPSRARWMAWLADLVGMQDIGEAQVKAQLKSVYGDDIQFPDADKRKIAGGDIGDRYENHQHLPLRGPRRTPKSSSVGIWIFLSVLAALFTIVLILATFFGWYVFLRQTPSITISPLPPAASSGSDYIEFYGP